MEEGSPMKRNLYSDLLSGKKDDKVEIHTTPLFQFNPEFSESPAKGGDVTESEQHQQLPILSYLLEKNSEQIADKEIQTEYIDTIDIEIQAENLIQVNNQESQTENTVVKVVDQEMQIENSRGVDIEVQAENLIQINNQEIQTENFQVNVINKEIQTIENLTFDQEIQTEEIFYEKPNKAANDDTMYQACDTTLPETNASQIRLSELNFSMIPAEKKMPKFEEMKTVLETEELKENKPEPSKRSLLTSLVLSVIPFAIGSSLTFLLLKKRLR